MQGSITAMSMPTAAIMWEVLNVNVSQALEEMEHPVLILMSVWKIFLSAIHLPCVIIQLGTISVHVNLDLKAMGIYVKVYN